MKKLMFYVEVFAWAFFPFLIGQGIVLLSEHVIWKEILWKGAFNNAFNLALGVITTVFMIRNFQGIKNWLLAMILLVLLLTSGCSKVYDLKPGILRFDAYNHHFILSTDSTIVFMEPESCKIERIINLHSGRPVFNPSTDK